MTAPFTPSNVDRNGLPEWGEAKDGWCVQIQPDEILSDAYGEWLSGACHHTKRLILKRQDSAGRDFYVQMCSRCGMRLSSAIAHKDVEGLTVCVEPQEVFENRHKNYESWRRQALEKIADEAAERQQPARRAEYAEHLSSDQWRDLRAKVMKRANGTCEGCLDAPAAEVHHKTYAHIRSEFAFELVALCSACHDRLHRGES